MWRSVVIPLVKALELSHREQVSNSRRRKGQIKTDEFSHIGSVNLHAEEPKHDDGEDTQVGPRHTIS